MESEHNQFEHGEQKVIEIVLIGGGHANVQVIKGLANPEILVGVPYRVTLVSNYPSAYYSGMLPGRIHQFTPKVCSR